VINMAYTYNISKETDFAKARVEDINASYKDLTEVCHNIRMRPADIAVEILEDAKAKKRPIKYRSHNTRMAHRKELQGQKGRWPVKSAGIVLKCLQSAIANAKEKGLSEELVVVHASANKKRSYMRYSSKGRRNISKLETARVEIVLKEKTEGKKKRLEQEKKAVEEKKRADAAKKAEEAKKAAEKPKEAPEAGGKEKEIKPAPEKPAAAPKPADKPKEEVKMMSREDMEKRTTPTETDITVKTKVPDSGNKAQIEVDKKTTPKKAPAAPKEEKKAEAPKPEPKKEEKPPEKKAEPKTENPKPEKKDEGKDEVA
jgi:ribosomal protein uL22